MVHLIDAKLEDHIVDNFHIYSVSNFPKLPFHSDCQNGKGLNLKNQTYKTNKKRVKLFDR